VKLLLLDLWGTVFYPNTTMEQFWSLRAAALRRHLEEKGHSHTHAEVLGACREARRLVDRIRRTTLREVPVEGEIAAILHLLGVEEDPTPEMAEDYLKPYVEQAAKAPHVEQLIHRARENGYLIAVASNTMSWRHAVKALRRLGLLSLFDAQFYSDIVGWRKPSPAFFQHILSTLNAQPRETTMIGDEEDDIAAGRLGIKTIAYEGFHPYTGTIEPHAKIKDHLEAIQHL